MSYYLSEIYSQLPNSERKRIQKRAGTILGESLNPEKLRKTILTTLRSGSSLNDLLEYMGLGDICSMIITNAGVISAEQITTSIYEKLKQLPHFVFPVEGSCFLCAEALELHLDDFKSKTNKSLYKHLMQLSPRERNAYCRWLGVEKNQNSGRFQSNKLYRKLLHSGSYSVENHSFDTPLYLDEIWSNDPNQTQLAWFFRDILPFYQCLNEEEERIKNLPTNPGNQMDFINAFKYGRLVIEKQPPEYEKETRYRVYPVVESANYANNNYESWQFKNDREQGVLFS